MSSLVLWHGSSVIVERPRYGLGKKNNDYGRGFYCTEHLELAKEWASAEHRNGFANKYTLDLQNMNVLNLENLDCPVLRWLALLTENRRFQPGTSIAFQGLEYLRKHFLTDISAYDVIRGYRADDSYFSFAKAFIGNGISLEQLSRSMRLGELGEQIVIRSHAAFDQLCFEGFEEVDSGKYYIRRRRRDEAARTAYRLEAMQMDLHGVFMRDILRERMEADDVRLQ